MLSIVLLLSITFISTTPLSRNAEINAAAGSLVLSLSIFARNLSSPTGITNAGSGDDRLFVIERAGRIKIIERDGTVLPTPFLNIIDRVEFSGFEQGLLGLTFHPDYADNGYFYVNYTSTPEPGVTQTRISRFQVTDNPDAADPDSEDVLITVDQPDTNHNAGDIHFGPDGFLFIPLGDGGGGRDVDNNAQNPGTLLGKIVRIDVDSNAGGHSPDCKGVGTGHYTVPAANPLIDGSGGNCDEIWALGLRNPWQSSFDRVTGDLYIGDVGQQDWEEVDYQPAGSEGGENYGWRCYEGNHPLNLSGCGQRENYVFPIFEYSNPVDGCSVIGGYVYRGNLFPDMYGHYILTDFCSGFFWDLVKTGNVWQPTRHTNLAMGNFVAFGEDATGEIYVVNGNGNIYHVSGHDDNAFEEWVYLPLTMK